MPQNDWPERHAEHWRQNPRPPVTYAGMIESLALYFQNIKNKRHKPKPGEHAEEHTENVDRD